MIAPGLVIVALVLGVFSLVSMAVSMYLYERQIAALRAEVEAWKDTR